MDERLVRKEDWNRATANFVNEKLRNENDPVPKFITKPIHFEGARARSCVQNAVAFCAMYPEHEAVMGFKMWVMPTFGIPTDEETTPFVCVVHVVARHKETGKYVDVTPPDPGDEDQKMLFVPSSRLYPGWSAEEIADFATKGFEPRMGHVCNGAALTFKQLSSHPDLVGAKAEDLKLLFAPALTTVQRHLNGPSMDLVKTILTRIDAYFTEDGEYVLMDATKFRPFSIVVTEAAKLVAARLAAA
jgi:hypothetical protein